MTEPVAPIPGSAEHDTALAASFDARQAAVAAAAAPATPPSEEAPKRPEGVPEKFWNATTGVVDHAAWAKSYSELEKKQSQSKPTDPPKDDQKATEGEAAEALKEQGLNVADFSKEFSEQGALSEDSYTKLAKAGFDKTIVDAYIAGQQALATQYDAAAFEIVGGADNYTTEVEWAKANMTPGEIASFNAAVSSGSADQMKLAVSGLHHRYSTANGTNPKLVGGSGNAQLQSGFRSRAEQSAAINKTDERGRRLYQIDPAYRRDVESRMATASFD